MIEPLFWNPLPAAAAWLTQRTGRAFDARSLVDTVAGMGKQGTSDPTIIIAILPREQRFAILTMPALETDPVDVVDDATRIQRWILNDTFGPLPVGMAYVEEAYPTVNPLPVEYLRELLMRGEVALSLLRGVQTESPREWVWLMPWGTTHRATLETCGINRADLLALGDTLTADTAPPPVVVAANSPLPVATGDVAFAFDGLRKWDEKAWKDTLGSPPKWLKACIVIPGRRGINETRWNPVSIGAALVHDGHAKANSVRSRFQIKPQLMPWLDAWETYEADYLDTA